MSENDAYTFNLFSTNKKSGLKEFLDSNSLVAKFAFLLLVIFLFVILLRLGIILLTSIFARSTSNHLVRGMVDAKQAIVIPQDPSANDANTIYRSINAVDGIEFTWSVWIFIDDLQYLSGQFKHIFHKGNNKIVENGLNMPNNAPGLYIAPNTNALVLIMNTFNVINEEIIIPDIPLNKWVNVIIRCQNTTLDVYINGTISRSTHLSGVPKQNYGDVYVAMNGGFSGYISNLWYFNYALGTAAIQNIANKGADANMKNNALHIIKPEYLSLRWYFYGADDGYNP
jgi:hypothetical protein